jgi:hypothetical protein
LKELLHTVFLAPPRGLDDEDVAFFEEVASNKEVKSRKQQAQADLDAAAFGNAFEMYYFCERRMHGVSFLFQRLLERR